MQGHVYLPSHFLRQWLDDVEEEGEERGAGGRLQKNQKTKNREYAGHSEQEGQYRREEEGVAAPQLWHLSR